MPKQKPNAITVAAETASAIAKLFTAVEAEAQRIDQEQTGSRFVRALVRGGKIHALIQDGKTTIEVADGQVALSVTQEATK